MKCQTPDFDTVFENEIGMKFRLIPSGTFQMGSPEDEPRRLDEHLHKVTLTRAFYMGVYPVTQGEWTRVMGSNPSWFSSSGRGSDEVSGQDTSRFPVEQVSWNDAQKFLVKLNALACAPGLLYRLPTEAEWEYSCRAGTTGPFSFSGAFNGYKVNYNSNGYKAILPYGTHDKGPCLERPSTVGSYKPNGFGLYDMHGNVWEWCLDWDDGISNDYYYSSPPEDPAGPLSSHSGLRICRGGSWRSPPCDCRSAMRSPWEPEERTYECGFRVLCELYDPYEYLEYLESDDL